MKRIMTLVGAIVATVFHALFSLILLLGLALVIEALKVIDGEFLGAFVAIIMLVLTAVGIVTLIFTAIAMSAFSCDHEKYTKKRGLLLTAVVLNFVVAVFAFIVLCTNFSATYLLWFLASVAGGTLILVDICLEGKRVAKLQAEQQASEQPAEQTENEDPFKF